MECEKVIIEASKSIYRYLLKIGVKPAEAEDIVQDTIHKALVSIPNMQITYIKTWLYQVAINRHRDIARRQKHIEEITRPNTERSVAITSNGLFKSTVEYKTYKVIEGKPVKWEDEVYEYKVWNTFRRLSNVNPLTISDNVVMGNERVNRPSELYNNQTMEREMQFYLPFVSHNSYRNDIGILDGENKVAEMAVTFDKTYNVSEIKNMLPEGIHPVWYGVDTYYDKKSYHLDDVTQSAYEVYGFKAKPGDIEFGNGTEKDFLLAIQNGLEQKGKYYEEYKRIYDYLRGKKTKPGEQDIKVIGVVVTGTAADLQKLNGQNYVKAALLGATAENK
ncbi:alkaline phosphatase [Bacillus cereus]|uniref:anti sigma factor C-terminal domain-containing protein n=1 Tax=Bacillus nitratireducens TaxID=2026193 RepID=UPI000BED1052|nr:alkaline phosphatase [Bacillus cereus]PEQ40874.1 alkaline phosphatase [Bacillus cereus]PEX88145.1 alkaline phosphatase [Bacillus cereus]PFK26978.1 alkaline phosphatase [Bacillus cereus]PFP57014.1 alkaline phosphatase [Bacillus cereus]